jgi:hypothetical protein
MNTGLKIRIICLATTVSMFALPVADALARKNWG